MEIKRIAKMGKQRVIIIPSNNTEMAVGDYVKIIKIKDEDDI